MDEEGLLKSLDKTEACQRIKKIRKVYDELEEKQKKFCDRFKIHCESGCGKCCENYNPDITEVEAEYLAFGLISEGMDEKIMELLETKDNNSVYCPLYNFNDNEHHCSVYKWRPLICRLFGATASMNKEGHPCFRQCKWNNDKTEITTSLMESFKDDLVFMSNYGMMIDDIDSGNRKTTLVKDALINAILKIKFMIELEQMEENEDNRQ